MNPRTATPRIALLYPGDEAMRQRADPQESRFAPLFAAFRERGVVAVPVIYRDEVAEAVRAQLLDVHAVLVWHNPIEGGRTRQVLDPMLREIAGHGVLVSAHPEVILRLGTKDVLVNVRDEPFGSDAWRVASLGAVDNEVLPRLAHGARVLKQHRGHSGIGVWRVEAVADGHFRVQHAQRGASEETVDRDGLRQRLAPYFAGGGHMVDQAWQPRLAEGMVRAYLVGDRVAGFGHQAINALYPAEAGDAPPPGPRLYSDAGDPRFQSLRARLDGDWVQRLCACTGLHPDQLPLLWDADFLLGDGPGATSDNERYVLCEINVSSVAPFPPAATLPLVQASLAAVGKRMRR